MSTTGAWQWFTSADGLMALVAQNWPLGIAIVALVVFCETGLVFMPLLPGDSLLFTTGAFLGASAIGLTVPLVVVVIAAFLGDLTNYGIGRSRLGGRLLERGWVKPGHLARTREFFERYGGFTITIARFVPVVRTIAPFLAGLSAMDARRFGTYNALGALLWGAGLISLGFWLGRVAWVREHLSLITLMIIVVSVLPVLHRLLVHRRLARAQAGITGER
ncbi:MAG: VTT domain-containing protein [Burkholderiaceae bacterium]